MGRRVPLPEYLEKSSHDIFYFRFEAWEEVKRFINRGQFDNFKFQRVYQKVKGNLVSYEAVGYSIRGGLHPVDR